MPDLAPEQQIIMVLFAACSSLLRNWSRWSGMPSSTRVSQVPQTPSAQACHTPYPGKRPVLAHLSRTHARAISGSLQHGESLVRRKQYENRARRTWWSVHIEAWRKSGLSRRSYCRQHHLDQGSFARWLNVLVDVEALRLQAELKREERRLGRPRKLSTDMRSRAVQAFWAMHVEAMTWCGMSMRAYAEAHGISRHALRRWRDLIEANEVEID